MSEINPPAAGSEKPAITSAPIHPLLAGRWSPRAFQEGRPVEPQQLLALLEAGRWAPSGSNLQPWRFIVWDRHQDTAAFERAFDTLGDMNKIWVKRAPVLIGVFFDTLRADGLPNVSAAYDAGAAAFALTLQAEALGLATHQMGGFDRDALRAAFGIPDRIHVQTIIGLGYRAHADVLHEKARLRELAERERLALADIAFSGEWQRSFRVAAD